MKNYICKTCGVQHAVSAEPPPNCAICEDERQFIPISGQAWTLCQSYKQRIAINCIRWSRI